MIEVELPDGSIAEFPAGTSPDQIKQALAGYRAPGASTPTTSREEAMRIMQERSAAQGGMEGALARSEGMNQQAEADLRPPPPPSGLSRAASALRDNLLGDDDPTTQNFGERVGSVLNKTGEAMTLGLVGDEASAAVESLLPNVNYEDRLQHYRDQERILERERPGLAMGAELSGALGGALLPGGAIGTLAKGAPMLARIGAGALSGAGMGGTYGFMEGEGLEDRARQGQTGATLGGIFGGAAPVVAGGVKRVADAMAGRRAINQAAKFGVTTEALREQGEEAYRAINDADVQIKPEAFERAREKIVDRLRSSTGFDELPKPWSLTPNTARVSEMMKEASSEMADDPTAALPFRSLDQMRRWAGAAAGNVANKADQKAGMTVIEGLDDFIERLSPDDVVAGDVSTLQSLVPKARDIWSRMSKSQRLDDALEAEGNYLSGGASAIKNQFANILRNPKLSRGFTDAERKVMQRVVRGGIPQQILDYMGSGLGMMGQIGLGATAGPVGALAGLAGAAGTRAASEALTRRNAEIARAIVASGALKEIPQASEAYRSITDALMRRIGAGAAQ